MGKGSCEETWEYAVVGLRAQGAGRRVQALPAEALAKAGCRNHSAEYNGLNWRVPLPGGVRGGFRLEMYTISTITLKLRN